MRLSKTELIKYLRKSFIARKKNANQSVSFGFRISNAIPNLIWSCPLLCKQLLVVLC